MNRISHQVKRKESMVMRGLGLQQGKFRYLTGHKFFGSNFLVQNTRSTQLEMVLRVSGITRIFLRGFSEYQQQLSHVLPVF